ncbi:MAG: MATE family efflux transporter [Bacillota bacterium]
MAADTTTLISEAELSQSQLRRTIFAMVWPVSLENILQMLIGFVNTALVGRLGAATILAVGLSGRVGMFVWILLGMVGTGATVLIAQAVGARDEERVRRTAQQALLVALVMMFFISGTAYVYAPSLLGMFRATPEALPLGVTYLRILAFSMPFQALYLVMSAILRGMGNTRVPMQIAFVINIVNAGLSYVLISGRFGFPALGFRGPAFAAIVGQMTGMAIAAWYLYSTRSGVSLRLRDRVSLDPRLIGRLLRIGVPSSAEMFFWQLAAIILFRLINQFGTVAGAAYQLGLQAEGISYMPSAGFGIAATALVGRSLGAKNLPLAERYIRQIVRWGVTLSAFATAILVLAPKALMGILTNDQAVIAMGAQYLLIMGFSQIPQQISMTLGGSLRGAGDTVTAMVAAGVGIWGCRIPLAFLLSKSTGLGITGVWWAINIDQWVRVVIVLWRYFQGRWKTAVQNGVTEAAD